MRSPSPELRLAVAQAPTRSGSFEANLEAHIDLVERAAQARADMLLFGELSLSGYRVSRVELAAWDATPSLERMASAAPELVVVAGAPLGGSERPFNCAAVLAGGELVHRQDKLHLPSYPPFDEHNRFTAGSRMETFEVLGWRCAILICEDAWHIGLTERMAGDGVDLAIHMAASAEAEEGVLAGNRRGWPLVNAALALLGGRYVAFANVVGDERGMRFWGGSAVYGPDGNELAALGDGPGLAIVTLERATLDAQRARLPLNNTRSQRLLTGPKRSR